MTNLPEHGGSHWPSGARLFIDGLQREIERLQTALLKIATDDCGEHWTGGNDPKHIHCCSLFRAVAIEALAVATPAKENP